MRVVAGLLDTFDNFVLLCLVDAFDDDVDDDVDDSDYVVFLITILIGSHYFLCF